MSDLSPECAPKRTSAGNSEFMGRGSIKSQAAALRDACSVKRVDDTTAVSEISLLILVAHDPDS
jgi:hypothetical protein